MTYHDATSHQMQLLLTREATLAARHGRCFDKAVGNGDLVAARRFNPRVPTLGVPLPRAWPS